MIATAEPVRWTMDLIKLSLDGATTYASPDTRFLSALIGGFLLGWGITIWLLPEWVYEKAPEAVRKAILVSILS